MARAKIEMTMRAAVVVVVAIAGAALVAGCGSSKKARTSQPGRGGQTDTSANPLGRQIQAACSGKPLTVKPKLPASFPQIEPDKLTYTRQSTQGPTNVVEGYFHADVKEAHAEFQKELKGVGYAILFNELEKHDSEISWKGEGRTGQVAMREECGSPDKTYVHITNRPA
jgi:hypothetical protein